MTESHLTTFGIPGITTVPYGIHMCQFYVSRNDLIDGLLPYFLAGINHNERCIWIAADPLPSSEIKAEIGSDRLFQKALASGQLTLLDGNEWYGKSPNPEEIVQKWINEEESALTNGFNGLRITGNIGFLSRDHWDNFMEYEEHLHEKLRSRRMVVCCSYHREQCKPVEILEVVHRHHGVVERCDGQWEVMRPQAPRLNSKDF